MVNTVKLRKKRERIYAKQAGLCCFCAIKLSPLGTVDEGPTMATLEHKIPRCQNGGNRLNNLTVSCNRCNCLRGIIPFDLFKSARLWLPLNDALRRALQLEYDTERLNKLTC